MRILCPIRSVFVLFSLLTLSFAAFGQNPTQDEPRPTVTPTPRTTPTPRRSARQTQPQPAVTTPGAPDYEKSFQTAINGLRFREIGPATMGGRIDDIEVAPNDSRLIYVATAAGGILKSTNGGTSWTVIFDKEAVSSIGDIAISPSSPAIIWAGSGEANNRQSSSWGNGIYKSLDGGKTWKNMGLGGTMHIARIVVHPTNPDIVWVAALGLTLARERRRGIVRA